jgi:hypothetical protein
MYVNYVFACFLLSMSNRSSVSFLETSEALRNLHTSSKPHTPLPDEKDASGRQKYINVMLRAVYTRVFCVRFSVRDGATAQLLPLLFSRDHVRDRAKEAAGRRWHL